MNRRSRDGRCSRKGSIGGHTLSSDVRKSVTPSCRIGLNSLEGVRYGANQNETAQLKIKSLTGHDEPTVTERYRRA
jgi:hypothetical protein